MTDRIVFIVPKFFVQAKTKEIPTWNTYGNGPFFSIEDAISMAWASFYSNGIEGTRVVDMNSLKVVAEFYPDWDIRIAPEFEHLVDIEAKKKERVKEIL